MNGDAAMRSDGTSGASVSPPAPIDIYGSRKGSGIDGWYRTEEINLDLNKKSVMLVSISAAFSQRDKVVFMVHSRTRAHRMKPEASVAREHDEFLWLHSVLEENENNAGHIIPPAPPKIDLQASREKLRKLGEAEATMTKEEFLKRKQALEQEYSAQFERSVAMHEVFLQRIAAHSILCFADNFVRFLQDEEFLPFHGDGNKAALRLSSDAILLSRQKDADDFIKYERNRLLKYNALIMDAAAKSEKVVRLRKNVSETYSKLSDNLEKMARGEPDKVLAHTLASAADVTYKLGEAERRSANDEELKLTDTLTYLTRETQAAKDLLYRRMRCLATYETANKNMERARGRNKDIPKAEQEQADACNKFEHISFFAKMGLKNLKGQRVMVFKKNLEDLVDLEVKHCKEDVQMLEEALNRMMEI